MSADLEYTLWIIEFIFSINGFCHGEYASQNPSWNVFEIKYKYLEDLSDLKNYMRSALRGCRV